MKICIYGAGAIGGYLGVKLALAGADVGLVARGAHLAGMRDNGLKLLIGDEIHMARPRCSDDPAKLGPQDFVIISLKAHSVTGVIPPIKPLLGPNTALSPRSTAFPTGISTSTVTLRRLALESIDPGGKQWQEFGPERAIGCIVYPATEIEHRRDHHVYGDSFQLGQPYGGRAHKRLSALFAGRDCGHRCWIRSAMRSG